MSQATYQLRKAAPIVVVGIFLVVALAPPPILRALDDLLSLSSVALVLFSFGTLVWFVYWFFLRRMLRVRRIANARLARILREGGDAEQGEEARE